LWCYARTRDAPEEGFFFSSGKRVQIIDEDNSTQVFASLVVAREHMGLKRGVIEGCITRRSSSSYTVNGKMVKFRAEYVPVGKKRKRI
jgi:hypothetical protein